MASEHAAFGVSAWLALLLVLLSPLVCQAWPELRREILGADDSALRDACMADAPRRLATDALTFGHTLARASLASMQGMHRWSSSNQASRFWRTSAVTPVSHVTRCSGRMWLPLSFLVCGFAVIVPVLLGAIIIVAFVFMIVSFVIALPSVLSTVVVGVFVLVDVIYRAASRAVTELLLGT
ncbi:MAG: hypothetical protein SGPRY_003598 [Prymnesium sp.]